FLPVGRLVIVCPLQRHAAIRFSPAGAGKSPEPVMRIAVGGFQHETNTFAPSMADFAAFAQADAWPALQRGKGLLTAFRGMNVPVAGFIAGAEASGHTLLPLVWCSAT